MTIFQLVAGPIDEREHGHRPRHGHRRLRGARRPARRRRRLRGRRPRKARARPRTGTARSPPPTPASRSTRAGSPTTRRTSQYGNPAATFSTGSSRARCRPGGAGNPAFGLGATGTWATVRRQRRRGAVPLRGRQLEVLRRRDAAPALDRSRRRRDAHDRRRPQAAGLHRLPLLHRLRDPRPAGSGPATSTTCASTPGHGRATAACSEIAFGSGDDINGPVHTNDAIRDLRRHVPGHRHDHVLQPGERPELHPGRPTNAVLRPVFDLPATRRTARSIAHAGDELADQEGDALRPARATCPRPGCLYTGPTRSSSTRAAR